MDRHQFDDDLEPELPERDVPHMHDERLTIRRQADVRIGERVTSIHHAIVLGVLVGGLLVGMLAWMGLKLQSPADALANLQGQIDNIRKEGMQRDTLIRGVARSVNLLTYYRCIEQNEKMKKETGHPGVLDCVRLLQESDR